MDGDGGLAVLRVPTAEQRADADVPAAHSHGGEEGAHSLRRGSGWRRGCRRHRRAPTDSQALAPTRRRRQQGCDLLRLSVLFLLLAHAVARPASELRSWVVFTCLIIMKHAY